MNWLDRQDAEPVTIYQCYHKPYPKPKPSGWILPITVGEYTEEGVVSEQAGDSRVALNPYFNEISALYWIWKNTSHPMVGLYHYRRMMGFRLDTTWKDPFGYRMEVSDFVLDYFSSSEQLAALHRLMSCSDLIIPRLTVTAGASAEQYCKVHDAESWSVFVEELDRHLPELSPYRVLYDHTNLVTAFNMFVMRREWLERYCEDLFKVLDAVFARIGPRTHFYLKRYPGFLAERFLLPWMRHHRLRVAEVPMILIEEPGAPEPVLLT